MARQPGRARSHPGLDAYRGAAVVLMYVVHVRRLQHTDSSLDEGLGESALQALMWAEPFIAASFLFIVGFSLVLAQSRYTGPHAFLRRVVRRFIELYLLSVLLFIPHYGLQWPDGLTSSGILSAIALAILTVGSALVSRRPATVLGAAALGMLVATFALDVSQVTISGLNGGPGGALPIVAFAAAGALAALAERRAGARGLVWAAAATVPLLVAALIADSPWITLHASSYAEYRGGVAGLGLFEPRPARTIDVRFWNHSSIGVIGLMLPIGLSLVLFIVPQRKMAGWMALGWLKLLGRHALAAYVGHLVVLGALAMVGLAPPTAAWSWGLVAMLTACACLIAAAWERLGRRTVSPSGVAAAAGHAHSGTDG